MTEQTIGSYNLSSTEGIFNTPFKQYPVSENLITSRVYNIFTLICIIDIIEIVKIVKDSLYDLYDQLFFVIFG